MPPKESTPRPRAYLAAGLPLPPIGHRLDRQAIGGLEDVDEFLSDPSRPDGARHFTALDSDGTPLAVVSGRSNGFTVAPPNDRAFNVVGWPSRNDNGFLQLEISREGERPPFKPPVGVAIGPGDRLVTADMSVALSGFKEDSFERGDVLFLSAAIAIELAVVTQYEQTPEGLKWSTGTPRWMAGIPVAVDVNVLHVFQRIVRGSGFLASRPWPLDRTDLLCAATAILYDSPLYTTKPEAYASVKNGLRTIRYGAPDSAPSRSGSGAPAVATDLPTWAAFLKKYESGSPFDDEARAFVEAAVSSGADLSSAFCEILSDPDNLDHSWRLGILMLAPDLPDAAPRDSPWHRQLISSLGEARAIARGSEDEDLISEHAMAAWASWGTWPEDADPEIFVLLAADPTDPELLTHYRAYLAMAGVRTVDADEELARIRQGDAVPSASRVESLVRPPLQES